MKTFLTGVGIFICLTIFTTSTTSCGSSAKLDAAMAERDSIKALLNNCEDEVYTLKNEIKKREDKLAVLNKMIQDNEELINRLKETLEQELTDYDEKDASVKIRDGQAYISFSESLLFPSGRAEINSLGEGAIQRVARVLIRNPELTVFVEGHTDDVPIKSGKYKDNWDLAVARASNVVRLLIKYNLEPERIISSGRAEYSPVVSNDTPENRAQNRRIDLIIAPKMNEMYNLLRE